MGESVVRLRVQELRKRFGRHVVLDGVDLSVHAGELVALVGENGAGKTTLVRCVTGASHADGGEIDLDSAPGVVWQDLALCENLDVTANLFLGREPGGFWVSDSNLEQRARAILDELGIAIDDLHRPVGSLSGGQRQSLAIARALVDRPTLLVLDEPTASLGVMETRAVEQLLRELRDAGCALLLISHRIEQLFGLADRIVVLRHGRVVADRPTVELHPDDVVSLMAGLDTDTTARRQMERLRSLVEQLAEVEPGASMPLIISALANAVGSAQICLHLSVPSPHDGPPTLRRRAAVGVPVPLLRANAEVPIGAAGGIVGLAAERAEVVVTHDVRSDPAWRTTRDAADASGVLSGWAMPIRSADGVLGVISLYAETVGRPQPAVLQLAAMYTDLAVAAIERERLLEEVIRRNRILESLRGMLDSLAGPAPDEGVLMPALRALCVGLGADAVVVAGRDSEAEPGVETEHRQGHEHHRSDIVARRATDPTGAPATGEMLDAALAAARGVLTSADGTGSNSGVLDTGTAVAVALAGSTELLAAAWRDPTRRGDAAADLLMDAARSISLALEREDAVSALLEAEALRRSQRTQREFLSRLSHELRTPLTAIHGYASTLRQPDVTWDADSESRFLDVIVGESARMGRLVADLLDSSTIEAGGLRLDRDWCDLRLTIKAAVDCVAGAADVATVDVDPQVATIWVDHDRLEQVLVNLLDNAVRHGPAGGAIAIAARPAADRRLADSGSVEIMVRDCGAGFAADLGDRAFHPYVRGDAAAPGAGLGLAVCRGIVDAHGGMISSDGAGTVTVILPAAGPDQTEPALSELGLQAPGQPEPGLPEPEPHVAGHAGR